MVLRGRKVRFSEEEGGRNSGLFSHSLSSSLNWQKVEEEWGDASFNKEELELGASGGFKSTVAREDCS